MNKRRALCVGINDYPGFHADLNGCVNDAYDWAELLRAQGYDVQILLDSAATFPTVQDALFDLVDSAGFGDRAVFTYSGHGTWLPDRDGDEADGRDEALCLHDYQNGGLLTDDHIQGIFGRLKRGAGGLILSDSCHSGTVSRLANLDFDVPGMKKPRFLSPVEFTNLDWDKAIELEARGSGNPRATASLVSGSTDEEYSWDAWFKGRANGAFSRAAIDAFRPGIRLGAWHKAIRAQLPTLEFPQAPQLTVASPYRRYARAL